MLLAALVQAGLALAAWRGRAHTAIVVANLGIVAAWAMSRTVGLPVGPLGVEAVTVHDAVAAGLALVAVAATLRPARPASRPSRSPGRAPVASGVVVAAVLSLVGPGGHDAHVHELATSRLLASSAAGRALAADPDVHLHGLAGDEDDLGADPARTLASPLDGIVSPVTTQPAALARSDDGAVWIAHRSGSVSRIDPRGTVTRSIPGSPVAIVSAFDRIWVADLARDVVVVLDADARIVATIPVAIGPVALAATRDRVWVSSITDGLVQPIDPVTLRARNGTPVGYGPIALAAFEGDRLVIVNALDRAIRLARTDRDRIRLGPPIAVDAGPSDALVADGRIWVASASAGTVQAIDPATGEVTARIVADDRTQPGIGPAALAAADGRIFVVSNHDRSVRALDPVAGTLGAPRFFGNLRALTPMRQDALVSDHALVVTDFEGAAIARLPLERFEEGS